MVLYAVRCAAISLCYLSRFLVGGEKNKTTARSQLSHAHCLGHTRSHPHGKARVRQRPARPAKLGASAGRAWPNTTWMDGREGNTSGSRKGSAQANMSRLETVPRICLERVRCLELPMGQRSRSQMRDSPLSFQFSLPTSTGLSYLRCLGSTSVTSPLTCRSFCVMMLDGLCSVRRRGKPSVADAGSPLSRFQSQAIGGALPRLPATHEFPLILHRYRSPQPFLQALAHAHPHPLAVHAQRALRSPYVFVSHQS